MAIAHAIAPLPSLQLPPHPDRGVQACSTRQAAAEAAEEVEAAEEAEVKVEEGWVDSRQDLEDPVCAHAVGTTHLMQ